MIGTVLLFDKNKSTWTNFFFDVENLPSLTLDSGSLAVWRVKMAPFPFEILHPQLNLGPKRKNEPSLRLALSHTFR